MKFKILLDIIYCTIIQNFEQCHNQTKSLTNLDLDIITL